MDNDQDPEFVRTAVCPGGTCGDEKTVRNIPGSAVWVCRKCGRTWNDYEVKAGNK